MTAIGNARGIRLGGSQKETPVPMEIYGGTERKVAEALAAGNSGLLTVQVLERALAQSEGTDAETIRNMLQAAKNGRPLGIQSQLDARDVDESRSEVVEREAKKFARK